MGEGMAPNFFALQKEERETGQKRKSFKVETIRTSRIQKFFLAANHGDQKYFLVLHVPTPTSKSISPILICLVPNSITIWP